MRFSLAAITATVLSVLPLGTYAQTLNFGTPPSSRIPILFNDHHVYAKPDELRRGRLLAALVRGDTIFVPLRSMFEQAGATVTYDRLSRTTTLRKPGIIVEVTVGLPEVRINGEVRPLDVPPIAYGDEVLVPVRVLAEALGAYVEYKPDLRVVVVRVVVAQSTPPPAPVQLQLSSPAPVAIVPRPTVPPGPPIPEGTPEPETYLVGDVTIAPKVANALSPDETGATGQSFDVRAASEFSLLDVPLELDAEYARDVYPHPSGFVTALGGNSSAFVPAFDARDSEIDVHLGAQLSPQKVYFSVGYLSLANNYGYPAIRGLGVGLLKLPILSNRLSYDAGVFYYPNITGFCGLAACPTAMGDVSYGLLTYSAGATYAFGPFFIETGYRGDRGTRKSIAPVGFTHDGPFAGLGLHL